MHWQEYALGVAGALILILIGSFIKPLVSRLSKAKDRETDTLERKIEKLFSIYDVLDSKLSTLDKSFAVASTTDSVLNEKLNTYFRKMDSALATISQIQTEHQNILGASKTIQDAVHEYSKILDDIRRQGIDLQREAISLIKTTKKRQVMLYRQVLKLNEALQIEWPHDEDIFFRDDLIKD